MIKPSTSTLVHAWKADAQLFRLVAVGNYTRGYADHYVIERCDSDALGGARWLPVAEWKSEPVSKHSAPQMILAAGIVELVAELARAKAGVQ